MRFDKPKNMLLMFNVHKGFRADSYDLKTIINKILKGIKLA